MFTNKEVKTNDFEVPKFDDFKNFFPILTTSSHTLQMFTFSELFPQNQSKITVMCLETQTHTLENILLEMPKYFRCFKKYFLNLFLT